MTQTPLAIGDTVAISPASDWFMKGVKIATVVAIGPFKLTVRATLPRPVEFRILPELITVVERKENP
jgi:hypothetical protein